MEQRKTDIVIIGGGIGGCMAALSAAKMGQRVVLTEETDWIGGQLTAQGVPPDEHKWIESFGCTSTYRYFRNRVRDYYHTHYPLTDVARKLPRLNPGNGWVSRLCHEPRVALSIFYDMLGPYLSNGQIELLLNYKAVQADVKSDEIESVTVQHVDKKNQINLLAHMFLDATECGDVLPLAGVEYVTGAESKGETKEFHAQDEENPLDMQSITHVFAVEYREGENHVIDKPEQYQFWKAYQAPFLNHKQLSWYGPDADTGDSKEFKMFPSDPDESVMALWDYRRIIDKSFFTPSFYDGDISLINWPQNDYWLGPIYDVRDEEGNKHREGARQLSLSLLYWLQTEAPRPDGGYGYPGLKLRGDVLGTEDGLAKYPYIRESRRIKAEFTVLEQHINADERDGKGIESFFDSIGVGCYRIDLHPTTITNQLFYTPSLPFEIPLGALLPIRVNNLIPACKNIGATHITNGCFRVHPVEWNIGESAGYLAAFAMQEGILPREVRSNENHLKKFQMLLVEQGIELKWPEIKAI